MLVRFAFPAIMLVFGLAVAPAPALAQSQCDSIKNAFAYNECLAKSAPPRSSSARRGTGTDDPESTVRGRSRRLGAAAPDQPQVSNGVAISRGRGRRVSAVIDPWAGARSAGPSRKRRR